MADESDDDLYGDETAMQQKKETGKSEDNSSGDEPMDEESGDEDDSDSDIDIIIEKAPAPAKPAASQQSQDSKAIKIEPPAPSSTPSQQPPPKTAPAVGGTVPQISAASLAGTAFPAQRTSTIDVNGNPIYPPQGKELLSVDIDADLAEEQKIWRRPGEDQSDYFNYGFDEFTWELYRQRQVAMANTIQSQKNDMAQMQAMMGGGPMPGMPGMPGMGGGPQGNAGPGVVPPTGPGGGGGAGAGAGGAGAGAGGIGPGGMNEQQMQMMMQEMMAQGMDPSQMDFASFMQMAGQGMGGFPGGPGGQQGGGFQQAHQGGGGRGRGGRGRGW